MSELEEVLAKPAQECLALGLNIRQAYQAFGSFLVLKAVEQERSQVRAAELLGVGQAFISRMMNARPRAGLGRGGGNFGKHFTSRTPRNTKEVILNREV